MAVGFRVGGAERAGPCIRQSNIDADDLELGAVSAPAPTICE